MFLRRTVRSSAAILRPKNASNTVQKSWSINMSANFGPNDDWWAPGRVKPAFCYKPTEVKSASREPLGDRRVRLVDPDGQTSGSRHALTWLI